MLLSPSFGMSVNCIYLSCWGMIGCSYRMPLSAWSLVVFLPWFIFMLWWSRKLRTCCHFLFLLEYVVSLRTEKIHAGKLSTWNFPYRISRLLYAAFTGWSSVQTCMNWYKVYKSGGQEKGTAFPLYLFQKENLAYISSLENCYFFSFIYKLCRYCVTTSILI